MHATTSATAAATAAEYLPFSTAAILRRDAALASAFGSKDITAAATDVAAADVATVDIGAAVVTAVAAPDVAVDAAPSLEPSGFL